MVAAMKKKVTIVGSGNWGSAISCVIGENVARRPELFHPEVVMWVFEEVFDGRKLSDIINTEHENKKYLPGIPLPNNVVAVTDSIEAVKDADFIVFVTPHQFIERICIPLKGHVKPTALGISLAKGVNVAKDGICMFSDVISDILGIEVGVLSGANVAKEVALGYFCESTIAFRNLEGAEQFRDLIETPNLRINVIDDVAGAQIFGALKNVVAIGAGTIDGLGLGPNTKAAVIRMGLVEMKKFTKAFIKNARDDTMFESCGVADLIVTCYAGRNRLAAEHHARTGKSFEVLEKELLDGQSLQGRSTSKEVHEFLAEKGLTREYSFFETVYKICYEDYNPKEFVASIRSP